VLRRKFIAISADDIILSLRDPKILLKIIKTIKYLQKHKRPQIAKAVLSKMSNTGDITIHDFKLYYRATTIKTAWYLHKNRQEDQWIRIEDPDISPHFYSQLIFDKGAQNT
jgi:hypothetical protein